MQTTLHRDFAENPPGAGRRRLQSFQAGGVALSGSSSRARSPVAERGCAGAVAFSRTKDPSSGAFGDAKVFQKFGESAGKAAAAHHPGRLSRQPLCQPDEAIDRVALGHPRPCQGGADQPQYADRVRGEGGLDRGRRRFRKQPVRGRSRQISSETWPGRSPRLRLPTWRTLPPARPSTMRFLCASKAPAGQANTRAGAPATTPSSDSAPRADP